MHSFDQTILIVEQDAPTRALYLRELGRDYRAFACANEYDALDIARSQPISAIVLEPALPDGAGWSLLARLRELFSAHDVPIILCSTLDERRRGMMLGATVYLVKPVLPTTLLATLQRLVCRPPNQDN